MKLCENAPHNHAYAMSTFTTDVRDEVALCLECLRERVGKALDQREDFTVRPLPHVPPRVFGRRKPLARLGSILR